MSLPSRCPSRYPEAPATGVAARPGARVRLALLLGCAAVAACMHGTGRLPEGPPPEYEDTPLPSHSHPAATAAPPAPPAVAAPPLAPATGAPVAPSPPVSPTPAH